ncbi:Polysaccharide biosynthesis protein [Sphaerotilus natans]|uniref:oligosaccharide flippase family protein n=1 Tax=Sphaerotilus natans TaxID=34103 RepID=UPI00055E172B|nr:oligosaccharide flippase family protein [Sphaerotilus natans]SIS08560.1 Polysaccharide biosynthesis protein [Sphaerotilus natans]
MGQLKWVAIGQVVNLILPIILFPVLASRLGVAAFSVFVVLTGVSQYACLGVELGFNHVSLARLRNSRDLDERSIVFSAVFYLKLLLGLLIGVIVAGGLVASGSLSRSFGEVFALVMGSLLTCVVYPAWYFVVIERQKSNFIISLVSRSLLFLCIWFGVHSAGDVIRAVAAFNYAFVPAGLIFSTAWMGLVRVPWRVPAAEYRRTLSAGLGMSGAMLRETATALGVSPLLGLLLGAGPGIGLLAFAEKIAKIIAIPAPMVASTLMVGWDRYREYRFIAGVLIGRGNLRARLSVAAVTVVALLGYALTAQWVIGRWFPAYSEAMILITILLIAIPFIYLNYIIVAIDHLSHENFVLVGRVSMLQVMALMLCASLAQFFAGNAATALVVAISEFLLFGFLIRLRRGTAS